MFLDANIFIYARGRGSSHAPACAALLRDISLGHQHATTSWLVVNEVVNYYLRDGQLDAALAALDIISKMPNLEVFALDQLAGSHVSHYLRLGLITSDAFHAATMKAHQIGVLCSYDKGFDRVEGIRRVEPK